MVLLLDTRLWLVAVHEVSTGSLNATIVHPREVFGPALRMLGVSSVILAHNHPSGDPTPSKEDLELTSRLRKAGDLLQIPVYDHVIIGGGTNNYVSLKEHGSMGVDS